MSTEEIEIPVFLSDPREGLDKDFISASPIINVRIVPQVNLGTPMRTIYPIYKLMVDTGAEFNSIDESLIEQIGASRGTSAVVHGFGESKSVESLRVSLYTECGQIQINTDIVVTSLRKQGFKVDGVIGRSFLKDCIFESNGPNNNYSLHRVLNHNNAG